MRLNGTLLLIAVLLGSVLAALPAIAHASVADASGAQLIKYGGNPVLGPTPGTWDSDYTLNPRVLFDGVVYRMWYNGGSTGTVGIGYATSTNGFTWVKHGRVLAPGQSGTWDSAVVQLGSVFWNGTLFEMWYRGSNSTSFDTGAIGLATSKDGSSWVNYSGNPILDPTTFGPDQKYVATPYALKYAMTYSLWYTGSATSSKPNTSILYASSDDGIHWIKSASPALSPSTDPNAWDSGALYSPSVIYDGTNFELWYSALDKSLITPRIGLATSPDQMTWTRSPQNPILSPGPAGSWDSAGVEQPSIILTSNSYMVYYDGIGQYSTGHIGLATGPANIAVPEFPTPTIITGFILAVAFGFFRLRKTHKQRSGK